MLGADKVNCAAGVGVVGGAGVVGAVVVEVGADPDDPPLQPAMIEIERTNAESFGGFIISSRPVVNGCWESTSKSSRPQHLLRLAEGDPYKRLRRRCP